MRKGWRWRNDRNGWNGSERNYVEVRIKRRRNKDNKGIGYWWYGRLLKGNGRRWNKKNDGRGWKIN